MFQLCFFPKQQSRTFVKRGRSEAQSLIYMVSWMQAWWCISLIGRQRQEDLRFHLKKKKILSATWKTQGNQTNFHRSSPDRKCQLLGNGTRRERQSVLRTDWVGCHHICDPELEVKTMGIRRLQALLSCTVVSKPASAMRPFHFKKRTQKGVTRLNKRLRECSVRKLRMTSYL